jgi:predicted kinase
LKLEILVLRGTVASGKSTFARELCSGGKYVRVNKDDIRDQIFDGKWTRDREKVVVEVETSMIKAGLGLGRNVIVDSTNLAQKHIQRFHDIAAEFGAEVVEKWFDTPISECIRRDAARAKPVGEKVIRQMFDQYIRPKLPKQDVDLRPCYIFDLDGTLAKMNGRSPFDWNRVGEDSVNRPVAELARQLYRLGYAIFILSGRDGSCKGMSEKWLRDNGIAFGDFFIRSEGDNRKDSIVKRELYEQNIKGKYFVEAWFDDRDQVVAMVRDELNLPCFQVDWGNF